MLRKTVAAWTALTRRAVASLLTPSNPNRAISTAPIRASRPDLSVHHRPFHRFVLLLPAAVLSRGYARMARRIPPVQTKPEEDEDSESEKEERDLFLAEEEEEEEEAEEGEESEEWEGFVLDFGSDRKDKNEREDEQGS